MMINSIRRRRSKLEPILGIAIATGAVIVFAMYLTTLLP